MARVEGDGAAECRFRGIMLIAFPRDGAEIVVGVGRVRLQTVRLLEGGRCVVGSLALEQQHAEIEMGGREIRAQPEGAAEQLLRLGVAAGVTQQNGEIVERVDEARRACQRGAIMRLRLRHPRLALADARPYCAAAAVSGNSAAAGRGLVKAVLRKQKPRQIAVQQPVPRLGAERAAQQGLGFRQPPALEHQLRLLGPSPSAGLSRSAAVAERAAGAPPRSRRSGRREAREACAWPWPREWCRDGGRNPTEIVAALRRLLAEPRLPNSLPNHFDRANRR